MLGGVEQRLAQADNPYFRILDTQKTKFVKDVSYYYYTGAPGLPDANDKPKTFLAAYDEMIADMHNEMAVAKFMSKLASHFLPDEYSINSYLQQDLVAIYGTCEELLHALKHRPILSRDAATRGLPN